MPVRDQLIQIQRDLYDRFRDSARRSVGNLNPSLRRYFLEYQKEFTDYKGISSLDELLQSLASADIALCGDYHTLAEAQRMVLRLVKDLLPFLDAANRHLVLAFEMLSPKDNPITARFLAGEVQEKSFLRSIGFQKNWGFSWHNYRPLFDFARNHGVSIVGLNGPGPGRGVGLAQRDRFASKALVCYGQTNPRALVLGLIGDLHLAAKHLPLELKKAAESHSVERNVVVVHQNSERLFWKLAARGLEHSAGVLNLKKNVYCVMNTPPWVKLQSYLNWLEWDGDAFEEDFFDLCRAIYDFIGANEPLTDGFEIHWQTGEKMPMARLRGGLSKFRASVTAAVGGYLDPKTRKVFLRSNHINAASTQAALYLHTLLSGREREFEFPRQDFYCAVWFEALGFLGSKVINPHRRCHAPADFFAVPKKDPIVTAVTQHLLGEKAHFSGGRFVGISLPARPVSTLRALFYYRVARCLGQVLGNGLYRGAVGGEVSREEILALFRSPFSNGKKAQEIYLQWAARLDAKGLRDKPLAGTP